MANPKDVLVTTTSTVDGLKIKRYLKPVSAHIVAGTNFFSDFFASFSDVFGGRSQTYQKQLTSLYSEATERIKLAAYEIGANCILGLTMDMDEISGKGKSMFMLTAIGTAVILEKEIFEKSSLPKSDEKFENIGFDRINILRSKKDIILQANLGTLTLNDETWSFITSNRIEQVFPFVLNKFLEGLQYDSSSDKFYDLLTSYIDALPNEAKFDLLYRSIGDEKNIGVALKLSKIIKDLNLFDFNKSMELLKSENFKIRKIGLQVVTYDQPFYNKQDINDLQTIRDYVKSNFSELGKRTKKTKLLSSKEKEVWSCQCGETNDIDVQYCRSCNRDIYGFRTNEINPIAVEKYIQQKIELITEYIE